jgi:hypothetical protein
VSATVVSHRSRTAATAKVSPLDRVLRLIGALGAFGVYWIHVSDQHGFPGEKSGYMRVGYYALELAAVVAAIALMAGKGRTVGNSWRLAAAVALGPMVGYLLTRGPGLPGNIDDKGNWGEPLGVLSVFVEGALLLLSIAMLRRGSRLR